MIPKSFYYLKKSNEPRYSYIPTRYFDVNRLIKGLAYWRRTTPVSTQENKKIVLADWTAPHWSTKKREAVAKKLFELMQQGFNIYVWQNGQIDELTQNNLEEFLTEPQILERMAVPAVASTIEAAVIRDLPSVVKDEILILDDYYIECLLRPELFDVPRQLDIKKLLEAEKDLDKLIPALEKAKPPIACFLETDISEESNSLIEKLKERLPKIPIKTNFRSAKLTNHMVAELLATKKTTLGTKTILLDNLQLLDSVALNNLSAENYQQVLPHLKNITKLDLVDCNFSWNGPLSTHVQFPKLEKIRLFESIMSGKDVVELMTKAENLTSLKLQHHSRVNEDSSFSSVKLRQFKSIKFDHAVFSKKNLQELLINNAIELLSFTGGQVISETLTEIKSHDLSSIKTLNLSKTICDAKYLDAMFSMLPQLEHVTLVGVNIAPFTNTFTLKALKTLHIDLNRFNDIASAFDNIHIEKLTLIDTSTTKIPNLEKINLSQLKYFSLQKNKLQPQFLKKFLEKAVNLSHLDLQSCTNFNELQGQLNFATIDTLNLSHSDISQQDLKNILLHAKNLKRLDLTGCNNLTINPEIDHLLLGKQVYYPDHIKATKRKSTHLYATNSNPALSVTIQKPITKDQPTIGSKAQDSVTNDQSSAVFMNDIPINVNQEHQDSAFIDADTIDSPKQMNAKKFFYSLTPGILDPDTAGYRISLFNKLEIEKNPCSINTPFYWKNEGDLELEPCSPTSCANDVAKEAVNLIHSTTHNYFYGKKSLNLKQEWQPLPSLSPEERLTHFHLEPNSSDVEIQYSKRDNQYYIRSKKPIQGTTAIDFILEVPKKTSYVLPKEIKDLVEEFTGAPNKPGYGSGPLIIDTPNPTGFDYMNAILTQKKGSCKHRSTAFKYLMEQKFPNIPVRVSKNGVHMQAEVLVDDHWIECYLGGYPANLKISDENNPKRQQKEVFLKEISDKELFQDDAKIVQYLQTWKKSKQENLSTEEYCKSLLEPRQEKKYLVELPNKSSTQALVLAIKEYCKKNNKPLFYVDKPEDLICSASYMTNEKNNGVFHDGPGGPLHQFLTAAYDKNNPPIVLINQDKLDAEDIIHHNSLFEDRPKADGTPIPPGTIIINLMNMGKAEVYQGEDLTSRMDDIKSCPVSEKVLLASNPNLVFQSYETESRPTEPVNLFQAENWKDLLLGQWSINGNHLYFEEGALQSALAKNPIINIQNGLWENNEFQYFWQEAFINGYIDYEGQRIHLPKEFRLVVQEGYDWQTLQSQVVFEAGVSLSSEVLNPSRFSLFFSQYDHQKLNKSLKKAPGIIANNAGKTLSVNVTRELNEHEWAMLLTECKKHQVNLQCHVLPEVLIPSPLQKIKEASSPVIATWDQSISPLLLIKSNDQDATVYQLTQEFKDYIFIDVSDCDAADLLKRMDGRYDKKEHRFEFTEVHNVLSTALKENKKIIMSGKFSASLLDSLMPIILERAHNPDAKGALALVMDNEIKYSLPGLISNEISTADKLNILKKTYSVKDLEILSKSEIENEGLTILAARMRYYKAHASDMNTSKAWDGLYELSSHIRLPEFDLNQSEKKAREVIDTRIQTILAMFAQSPIVSLNGLTGVGKTTFVEKYLGNLPNVNLYMGESKLSDWAQDKTEDKWKVIFIDEPIGSRKYNEFEGLFLSKPSVVINGQHCFVSEDFKHVAVFASNPLSYGNDREVLPLFERHGNAYVFEPMIGEFIYEEVMKPLFEKTTLECHAKEVSQILLNTYRHLVNLSTKEVLISARELQLMVLLTLSYHHKHPNEDFKRIAAHYAYQIGKTIIPDEYAQDFDDRFKPVAPLHAASTQSIPLEKSKFLITPSRHEIYHLILDLFALRHFKQQHCVNNAQKFGGIGGIILEGDPGIGKSELVAALFKEFGFAEGTLDKEPETGDAFYHIPISMQKEEKETLLLRSLGAGANELIDEINTAPFPERWLNDLLMGKNPVTKEYPKTPGSLLFGTQNPVTMSGRKRPSNALSRRLITYKLPPYPQQEMINILIHEGVEAKFAEKLVLIYVHLVNYANENYLAPAPTFRHLLRLARIAKNSNQIEALKQFFNKVAMQSLRKAVLMAEDRFNGSTLDALGKLLTPETMALLDRHVKLFSDLIIKAMSEEKVKFMLNVLSFLNENFGQLNDEAIKDFNFIFNLNYENETHFSKLNAFFASSPSAFSTFCKLAQNLIPHELLISFIDKFYNYPLLVGQVLANEAITIELLQSYLVKSDFYLGVLNDYSASHQNIPENCLSQVLQLLKFFDEAQVNMEEYERRVQSVIRATPNTLDLLSKHCNIAAKTVANLLKYLTDETTDVLRSNPDLVELLTKEGIDQSRLIFLVNFLNFLCATYKPLTSNEIERFKYVYDTSVNIEFNKINKFFSKNNQVWPDFFKKIKTKDPINVLMFIDICENSGLSDIARHILASDNPIFSEILSSHHFVSHYHQAVFSYRQHNPNVTTENLSHFSQLFMSLDSKDRTHQPWLIDILNKTKPETLKLVTGHIDTLKEPLNKSTTTEMLNYLTDDNVKFFAANPNCLTDFLTKPIAYQKVQFLLKYKNKLKVTEGDLPAVCPRSVDSVIELLNDSVENNQKVYGLLANNPSAIPHVLERVKTMPLVDVVQCITLFSDYPDFMSHLLSDPAHIGLLQSFKEHGELYQRLIAQFLKNQKSQPGEIALTKLLNLCKFFLEQAKVDELLWLHRLSKAELSHIDLWTQWLTKNNQVLLNLFFSKTTDLVLSKIITDEFAVQTNKKLLDNSLVALFDFTRPYQFNKQRISVLHHLATETFVVAPEVKTANLWTKEKNNELLTKIFSNYTQLFANQLKKQNTVVLLAVAKELSDVSSAPQVVGTQQLNDGLKKELNNYLASFWVNKNRQYSANLLMKTIEQGLDYEKILTSISATRQELFINDSSREKNMHFFGSSRYYETLNKLEDMLINAWVQDKKALPNFKIYLAHYEANLKYAEESLIQARYRNHLTWLKPMTGCVYALAKEVRFRENALSSYRALLAKSESTVTSSAQVMAS